MSNQKAKNAGSLIGVAVGLAVLAASMAAAILPLFLLGAYLKNWRKSRGLRKEFPQDGRVLWLSEADCSRYKQIFLDCFTLREFVAKEEEHAENPRLLRKVDGGLDLRNAENKAISANLNKARRMLEKLESEVFSLEYKTFEQWHELNDTLKKCSQMGVGILGWVVGAAFFFARLKAGAPLTIWFELFVPALCAGAGVLLALAFSRYPAVYIRHYQHQ